MRLRHASKPSPARPFGAPLKSRCAGCDRPTAAWYCDACCGVSSHADAEAADPRPSSDRRRNGIPFSQIWRAP